MPIESFYTVIGITRLIIICLGIIGNLISFIVFCRPVFRKNSVSVYCRALAIFDCFTLCQLSMDISQLFYDFYPPDNSDIFCKIFYYNSTAFSCILAWILVAFSVDKVIIMKKSTRFDFFKKRSFQLSVVAVLAVFNLLLFSEVLILLVRVPEIKDNSTQLLCDLTAMPYIEIFGALYLIIGSLVPFLIMIATSVFTAKLLKESRHRSIGHGNSVIVQKRKNRDLKFAATSLTFNCLFIILTLPLVFYYVLSSAGIEMSMEYFESSSIFFFLNCSISFLVHFISNSIFRKELCIILRIRVSVPVEHVQSTRIIVVKPLNSID